MTDHQDQDTAEKPKKKRNVVSCVVRVPAQTRADCIEDERATNKIVRQAARYAAGLENFDEEPKPEFAPVGGGLVQSEHDALVEATARLGASSRQALMRHCIAHVLKNPPAEDGA